MQGAVIKDETYWNVQVKEMEEKGGEEATATKAANGAKSPPEGEGVPKIFAPQ